jgi:hypothetical protein
LIYNAVNIGKIHLVLFVNYYVVFKHDNFFNNENEQIISHELAQIESFMLFFNQNLTLEEKRNNQINFKNINLIYEAINLLKLIMGFLKKLYYLKRNDYQVDILSFKEFNKDLYVRFKDFYKLTSRYKIQYGYWIISFIIQFYFEILINHIENIKLFYLSKEFFIYCSELCKIHFESFSVSKL